MLAERRGSFRPQPKETVPYEIQAEDTLESIAARYKITPSELTILNKLSSRTVFPGQIIFIPEKSSLLELEQILQEKSRALAQEDSPKPGHVERVPETDPNGNQTNEDSEEKDKAKVQPSGLSEKISVDSANKPLRINSKHVTDGEGVVSGILIVTPNQLIFDPNVSDPLVIEYGNTKYGVIAEMQYIVRVALYPDIFRMRTRYSAHTSITTNKVNLYHAKNLLGMRKSSSFGEKMSSLGKSRRSSSALESGSSRLQLTTSSAHDNLFKICESGDVEDVCDDANPDDNKNDEAVSRTISCSSDTSDDVSSSLQMVAAEDCTEEKPAEDADEEKGEEYPKVIIQETSTKKKKNSEGTKNRLHKGLKKLSLTGNSLFSGSHGGRRMSLPSLSPSFPDFKFKSSLLSSDKKSKSLEDKSNSESSGSSYVNMVDEKPELFVSFDKLIPKPATSFNDTPLYLCLRMGQPIQKTLHRTTPVMHFGQQKMKPEYWFSIPKANVDTLYKFILRCYPEKYGDVEDVNLEELGFTPPEESEEDEMTESSASSDNNLRRSSWAFPWRKGKGMSKESSDGPRSPEWEFLENSCKESEFEATMPELLAQSSILNEGQILELNQKLPVRASSLAWTLIYSTTVHGFSLKTMYREMNRYDSPVLIAISSRSKAVFGALLSCPLKMSDHFYGTGESFLFTFYPEFKCYPWSGENDYFIKGNTESFSVGASGGHFGLWLDDDLYRGHSNACQTFGNPPLCESEDFVVRSLEAWGFV